MDLAFYNLSLEGDGNFAKFADATEQHFTGKDHDVESGLDYFYARYYSETLGRFMTPDWAAAPAAVPYASYGDPQSLNLYAYVQNNPLTGIDATGHCGVGNTAANAQCATGWMESSYELAEEQEFNTNVGYAENTPPIEAEWLELEGISDSDPSAQQQLLSSVDVLGNSVAIIYGKGLSTADEIAASSKISAGAALINANADSLTAAEKKAIEQISSFSVVGPGSYLGVTGQGSMTLSAGYIKASSAAWIGSLFGHEGQHYLNAGKFSGANLWRDEQLAGRTQLGIGEKIGFSSSETRYLENWIDDKNKAAMQQHMLQGYSY